MKTCFTKIKTRRTRNDKYVPPTRNIHGPIGFRPEFISRSYLDLDFTLCSWIPISNAELIDTTTRWISSTNNISIDEHHPIMCVCTFQQFLYSILIVLSIVDTQVVVSRRYFERSGATMLVQNRMFFIDSHLYRVRQS